MWHKNMATIGTILISGWWRNRVT